ncbi:MAG: hypothetical protein CME61_04305 [Halobacteriovoraceae bacterium]|nr:hypothetical protein [Halobacteriovoraceae bacterium]
MENQLHSAIEHRGKIFALKVYGYATRGIPGVEIVGLGNEGRTLKEKIIFLIKSKRLGISRKRIIISVDFNERPIGKLSASELEIPIFILFLSLNGNLKLKNLSDCFCAGTLKIPFGLDENFYNDNLKRFLMKIGQDKDRPSKIICPEGFKTPNDYYSIYFNELFASVNKVENRSKLNTSISSDILKSIGSSIHEDHLKSS